MGFVYILQSERSGRYYIGSTADLNRRLTEHNSGLGGIFSKNNKPWKLICYKSLVSISEARSEEKKIKSYKGGNAFKKIINGEVAEWSKAARC
ncbi:GIY-YIG nuclease family protein [Patescibacteria group bacterium]|nr:MAG: GIY-YIG nuclease family protein [Patescibacteria group bacterium]